MNAAPARCCTPSSLPEGGSSLRRLLPLQGLLLPLDATFSRYGAAAAAAAAAGVSACDGQS